MGNGYDLTVIIFLGTRNKVANQNTVFDKYLILIGQFWNRSTKIVHKSFITVSSLR